MTRNNDKKTKNSLPERVVSLALWKAVMSVLGIISVSALGSIWATVSVFNTVPFRVAALEEEMVVVKITFMPLDLSLEKWKNNDLQHAELMRKLDVLQASINALK